MDKLDRVVRSGLLSEAPDEEWLNAVLTEPLPGRRWPLAAIAATLLLGVTISLAFQVYVRTEPVRLDLVLQEVAMNHEKNLASEVVSSDLNVIQSSMQKIDFSLNLIDGLDESHLLIGARYCSVGGELAVQLKIRDRVSRDIDTLFVAPAPMELGRIDNHRTLLGGTRIRIWTSAGLLYALASDQP